MGIAEALKPKLEQNRREVVITDADDLLAAWRHRTENTFTRSFNFSRVPQEYRLSAPPDEKAPLMPCHVRVRRKLAHTFKSIEPAPEHGSMACHGHGRIKTLSMDDLSALDAVSFTRRNVAPYISPIFDTHTLALVCKDLGIHARAIPKVIKGRQYIAFTGYPGLRSMFPSTLYKPNNRKLITMAIGALGIKHMVKSGGILTIALTVPLTVLECFLTDQTTFSALAGNLASDLIKVGIASVMGAIFGLAVGAVTTVVFWPIGVAIGISMGTGIALNYFDNKYQLTQKLVAALEQCAKELAKLEQTVGRTYHEAERELMWRAYGFDIDNPSHENPDF